MKLLPAVSLPLSLSLSLLLLPKATHGYLTPTGQFCPHRSDAWRQYMNHLHLVSKAHEDFTQKDSTSSNLEAFLSEWDQLIEFGQSATDYQLLEYLTEPHFYNRQVAQVDRSNLIPTLRKLHTRQYQGDTITKIIGKLSSLQKKEEEEESQSQQPQSQPNNNDALIGLPPSLIAARPYDPADVHVQPDIIQEEHRQLLKDHKTLIESGKHFGDFNQRRKRTFMNEVRHVEERWDIVFQRFQLMNVLNPDYVTQCNIWLADLGLDEAQYKAIHQQNLEYLQDGSANAFFYYF